MQAIRHIKDRRKDVREGGDRRKSVRNIAFCGANFDPLSPVQTLERCRAIRDTHDFRYLVTPNVDHVVRLNKYPKLYGPLYNGAWISVCDSRILQLLAKTSGIVLHTVTGSDLTAQLFDNVITKDEAVNVIGGGEDMIAKVTARFGLTNLNHHQPPMGLRHKPHEVRACAKFIAEHPARYTFICVGSPQQEMIAIEAQKNKNCVGLGLCVGASLDFLAGKQKRAPKWMQNTRTEWLYRLLSEPKRMWKRYLIEGPKIFLIWAKWHLREKKTSHK
ncbi:MAG: WecB/TagA/CpsF family glycosyltransferase [Robiginitomaculum sp.]|nr:WecB/TagA/CpsF family glycosyltransferase [Robiginitomaculum sp.]